MGIEPTLSAWEAEVLPLNYTRVRESSIFARFPLQVNVFYNLLYLKSYHTTASARDAKNPRVSRASIYNSWGRPLPVCCYSVRSL